MKQLTRAQLHDLYYYLRRYEKYLCEKKLMTAEEKGGLEARVEKEIRDDVAFAEASPFPAPEQASRCVWV